MRRRITRALLAAAAAGATITSVSFAAVGPAGAAQTSDVFTTNNSGWAAGNVVFPSLLKTSSQWRFRYATGSTTVPDHTNSTVAANADPGLALGLAGTFVNSEVFTVSLSNLKGTAAADLFWNADHAATPGWSVRFNIWPVGGGAGAPHFCNTGTDTLVGATTFPTGSPLRLDVFYNQDTGNLEFKVFNGFVLACTLTEAAWVSPGTAGGGPFSEAYAGSAFERQDDVFVTSTTGIPAGPYTSQGDPVGGVATHAFIRPTGADFRLFPVTGVHFTSYSGSRGTVMGPWDFQQTIYGTSGSAVNVSSPALWNGGMNFGVWLRA